MAIDETEKPDIQLTEINLDLTCFIILLVVIVHHYSDLTYISIQYRSTNIIKVRIY